MAARTPPIILSGRDDGNDVQFEEQKGENFVCRNCSFHVLGDHVRLYSVAFAIKHLDCHLEDGHRIDPKALEVLTGRLRVAP